MKGRLLKIKAVLRRASGVILRIVTGAITILSFSLVAILPPSLIVLLFGRVGAIIALALLLIIAVLVSFEKKLRTFERIRIFACNIISIIAAMAFVVLIFLLTVFRVPEESQLWNCVPSLLELISCPDKKGIAWRPL